MSSKLLSSASATLCEALLNRMNAFPPSTALLIIALTTRNLMTVSSNQRFHAYHAPIQWIGLQHESVHRPSLRIEALNVSSAPRKYGILNAIWGSTIPCRINHINWCSSLLETKQSRQGFNFTISSPNGHFQPLEAYLLDCR